MFEGYKGSTTDLAHSRALSPWPRRSKSREGAWPPLIRSTLLFLKRFKTTVLGMGCAAVVTVISASLDLDLWESFNSFLNRMESHELDEIFLLLVVLLPCLHLDLVRERRKLRQEARTEAERLRMLRLTMGTVQDLVGNALQNLILLNQLAEEEQNLHPDTRKEMDRIIHTVNTRLRAIAELEAIEVDRVGSAPPRLKIDPEPDGRPPDTPA